MAKQPITQGHEKLILVKTFLGEVAGEILVQPRGERHFGWDAWFLPRGSKKTFAEMTDEEKDAVSHRGHAYRMLGEHIRKAGRD